MRYFLLYHTQNSARGARLRKENRSLDSASADRRSKSEKSGFVQGDLESVAASKFHVTPHCGG